MLITLLRHNKLINYCTLICFIGLVPYYIIGVKTDTIVGPTILPNLNVAILRDMQENSDDMKDAVYKACKLLHIQGDYCNIILRVLILRKKRGLSSAVCEPYDVKTPCVGSALLGPNFKQLNKILGIIGGKNQQYVLFDNYLIETVEYNNTIVSDNYPRLLEDVTFADPRICPLQKPELCLQMNSIALTCKMFCEGMECIIKTLLQKEAKKCLKELNATCDLRFSLASQFCAQYTAHLDPTYKAKCEYHEGRACSGAFRLRRSIHLISVILTLYKMYNKVE